MPSGATMGTMEKGRMEYTMKLRELRQRKDITQMELIVELHKHTGKYSSQATVSRWEAGNNIPPYKTLKALAEILGVTVEELVQ